MIGIESTRLKKKISRRLNFSIRERDFFYSRKNFFLFAKELLAILRKKNLAAAELFYSRKRFFLFAKELLTPRLEKKSRGG